MTTKTKKKPAGKKPAKSKAKKGNGKGGYDVAIADLAEAKRKELGYVLITNSDNGKGFSTNIHNVNTLELACFVDSLFGDHPEIVKIMMAHKLGMFGGK